MQVSRILCKYLKLVWIYNRNRSYYYNFQGSMNKEHDNENVKQKIVYTKLYYISNYII